MADPVGEVRVLAVLLAVQLPPVAVTLTQPQVMTVGGTLGADPADRVLPRGEGAQRLGRGDEGGLADPALLRLGPLLAVD
ncbi:hypothetical protein ACWEKM_11430 [Streptomyces sp. NPDC004752]